MKWKVLGMAVTALMGATQYNSSQSSIRANVAARYCMDPLLE